MDILNPYGDEPDHKSPGEEAQRIAGEAVRFVRAVGGPHLDEDSVAVLVGDFLAWWRLE